MTFKNEAQLRKFLLDKCANAVDNAKEKVHDKFVNNLNQFYSEFKPREYIRTNELFNSFSDFIFLVIFSPSSKIFHPLNESNILLYIGIISFNFTFN